MDRGRRRVIVGMGLAAVGLAKFANAATGAEAGKDAARRVALYRGALVWDDHSGFDPRPNFDLEQLEIWRRAGVNYLSIDVGYDVIDWQVAIANLGSYVTWLEKRPERFVLVQRADDIPAAKRAGKLAITFDLEGMSALNGDASLVSLYYRLGVRQMLVAYNRNNLAGGGCHDDDHGLTSFGREVIAEMNRVGMVVDCSHTGYNTTMQVMEAARQPVIFSHSNPLALHAHRRNITDDQIKACARTGGVIGINGDGLFLADPQAPTKTLTDCIVYVRDLVGVDHVGLGLDYTPADPGGDETPHPEFWPPAEYDSQGPVKYAEPGQMREIADDLFDRGWSPTDVRKVLGGNFFRVARAVWK
jgi:membrane dipeptidase